MKTELLYEVVRNLIGDIDPVIENHSNDNFDNLEQLCDLAKIIIAEILNVRRNKFCTQKFAIEFGKYADNYIKSIIEELKEVIEE